MKWKVRLNATFISETSQPPPDPVSHFIESVNNLFGHVFEDVGGGDIFGFTIYNEVNQSDTPRGFSFIRKDQLSLGNTERCLTATWVLDEIRLPIQKGYKVLDIIEVYEYEVKYDPQTREVVLFANYINT